jgi:hypothetical protein
MGRLTCRPECPCDHRCLALKGRGANAVEMGAGALVGRVVRGLPPSHERRRVLTRLERGLGGVQLPVGSHEDEHVPGLQAEVRTRTRCRLAATGQSDDLHAGLSQQVEVADRVAAGGAAFHEEEGLRDCDLEQVRPLGPERPVAGASAQRAVAASTRYNVRTAAAWRYGRLQSSPYTASSAARSGSPM